MLETARPALCLIYSSTASGQCTVACTSPRARFVIYIVVSLHLAASTSPFRRGPLCHQLVDHYDAGRLFVTLGVPYVLAQLTQAHGVPKAQSHSYRAWLGLSLNVNGTKYRKPRHGMCPNSRARLTTPLLPEVRLPVSSTHV
jgi:hypothetical protein